MGELKFEKAIQRLEKIVDDLEKGELDIDKSLEMFEEGIKMSRVCSKKLNEAEAKIEKLTRNQKGELITELFPLEDENVKLKLSWKDDFKLVHRKKNGSEKTYNLKKISPNMF